MFKTDNLTNVSNMFQGAKINTIDVRNMDFTKVPDYESMFDWFQGNEIIVKDNNNKKWIEDRLAEAGVSVNVIINS